MKLGRKDKDNLIILGVFVALLMIILAVYYGTQFIPLKWIGLAILAVEIIYCLPTIYSKYYKVNGLEPNFCKFVPGVNIIQVFDGWVSYITFALFIVIMVLCLLTFLPISIYAKVFDEHVAMNISINILPYLYLAIVLLDVAIGAGYSQVLSRVHSMLRELYHTSSAGINFGYYCILFIPGVRICGLMVIISSLNRLCSNGYVVGCEKETQSITEKL